MEKKILVTFASKYGSTGEIAQKIGEELIREGYMTDVLPVKEVESPGDHRAMVLGSALYMGRLRKEAVRFLRMNQEVLSGMPVWLFYSGPTGEGDPEELLKDWRLSGRVQKVVDLIRPRDSKIFHGALKSEKISSFEKWILKRVKAEIGDFRDWEAITNWTRKIAAELKEKPAV